MQSIFAALHRAEDRPDQGRSGPLAVEDERGQVVLDDPVGQILARQLRHLEQRLAEPFGRVSVVEGRIRLVLDIQDRLADARPGGPAPVRGQTALDNVG